jgi:hypothetical protein
MDQPVIGGAGARRYKALRILGQGGMGRVYEAVDRELRRSVAIKVMTERLEKNSDALSRLRREARVQSRVEHPHLLRLLDVQLEQPPFYMVMDLIEGVDLATWVSQRGPLPPREVAQLLVEVGGALRALHEADAFHRDLKPANVMRRQEGAFVLMDLGLVLEKEGTRLTDTGTLLGTPNHLPREVVMGKPWTWKGDQFQLGAVAFHALTGREHLPMKSLSEFAVAYLESRFGELRPSDPGGPELRRVIARAREPEPGDRYPSMEALVEDATRARQSLSASLLSIPRPGAPPVDEEPGQELPSSPAGGREISKVSRRPWGAGLVLLALGVMAGVAWRRLAATPADPVAPTPPAEATSTEEAFRPLRVAVGQLIEGHHLPDGSLDPYLRGGTYREHLRELVPRYTDARISSQWRRLLEAMRGLLVRRDLPEQRLRFFLELEVKPAIDHLVVDHAMVGLAIGNASFRVAGLGAEEFAVALSGDEIRALTDRLLEIGKLAEGEASRLPLGGLPPYAIALWGRTLALISGGQQPRDYALVHQALVAEESTRGRSGLTQLALAMVPPAHARGPGRDNCVPLGGLLVECGEQIPALAPRLLGKERLTLYGHWALAEMSLGYHCPEYAAARPPRRLSDIFEVLEDRLPGHPGMAVVQAYTLRTYAGMLTLADMGALDRKDRLPEDHLLSRANALMRRSVQALGH